MAIKLSQSLKQTQNLMMTPQLQQAIKLLTLTHLEMTNVIADEMVENPLLEEIDVEKGEVKGEEDYKVEKLEMQNMESNAESIAEKPIMENSSDDFDWNSYIESYENGTYMPPTMATQDLDNLPNYENIISNEKSLAEHLEWQLRMEELSEDQWNTATHIIHNINDDGYLDLPYEEIVASSKLARDEVKTLLHQIQRLDPVGCGAPDLVSCLLAQAWIMEERSPLLEKIIKFHLKDLQCRDYPKIAKAIGTTVDTVKDITMLLQNFHPKPGRLVAPQETHYVVPDIYVVEAGGEFVVKLNDDGVPRLRISQLYQSLLKKSKSTEDAEAREYVQDKLRSAVWLIKSIENRQKTIVKVANAIVKKQQNFFKKGPAHLKPMVLKNIADEIGMHESTVSRVTTNKYMHSPIGMFELKYFFNSGIGGQDGAEDISSEVLKLKIKELIDHENPKRPLSDQKIVELLGREGVKIARRTVAKYREMLGILSSSKRKIKS